MRIRQSAGAALVFALEAGLGRAEEQDAHLVARVRDDALLHELVCALERCKGGRVAVAILAVGCGLRRGRSEHGRTDVYREKDGILDRFEALKVVDQ